MPKVYSKSSFDRFGDDLCELILSYMAFEDKFRLECVAKQWLRVVFNRHYKLTTINKLSRYFCDGSVGRYGGSRVFLDLKRFEALLKVSQSVTDITMYF